LKGWTPWRQRREEILMLVTSLKVKMNNVEAEEAVGEQATDE
jgi:hypothetical protein